MNLFRQWPAALLSLAAFGVATAQEPNGGFPPKRVETPAKTATVADMREDVEILRRLLERGLGEAYGMPGAESNPIICTTACVTPEAHSASLVEGVYLKDYGVVYTATLPPPPHNPLPEATPGVVVRTPLSDWERTRKELRGEKVEAEGQPVNGPPPLSEVILKVLAENGRHFTSLAQGERITVAVTFRDGANGVNYPPSSAPWQNLPPNYWYYKSWQVRPAGMPSPGDINFIQTASPRSEGGVGALPRTAQEAPEWLTDVHNAVSLGDLHMKQGKTGDAIAAYKKAVDQLREGFASPEKAKQVPAFLAAVDLCNKLAAAYVQAGDAESAARLLKEAGDLAKKAETLAGAAATANPRPSTPALPNKLVVTASKKLLDDVGAGKMTFAEFCKAATVEYTGDAGGNAPQPVQTTTGAGGR